MNAGMKWIQEWNGMDAWKWIQEWNEYRNEMEWSNKMNTGMKWNGCMKMNTGMKWIQEWNGMEEWTWIQEWNWCSLNGNEGTNQCIIECTKQNAWMKNLCTNIFQN